MFLELYTAFSKIISNVLTTVYSILKNYIQCSYNCIQDSQKLNPIFFQEYMLCSQDCIQCSQNYIQCIQDYIQCSLDYIKFS